MPSVKPWAWTTWILLAFVPVVSSAATDPWDELARVREVLNEGSPLQAAFSQTFLPSGFSTGDTETGVLYVGLPRCLRFEYREPFPKDFLLCGDWVYTWNPGEPSGRRFLTTESEDHGLDLLRLEVEALRNRYLAGFDPSRAERTVIRLTPKDETAELEEAWIEAGSSGNLLALAYRDRSGNRTRFELTGYGPLESTVAFEPPGIEWLED